jgi:hypothetical protein
MTKGLHLGRSQFLINGEFDNIQVLFRPNFIDFWPQIFYSVPKNVNEKVL